MERRPAGAIHKKGLAAAIEPDFLILGAQGEVLGEAVSDLAGGVLGAVAEGFQQGPGEFVVLRDSHEEEGDEIPYDSCDR